ncbi:unnamed protein product, partial [Brassica rapa subsp. narinosa]
AKKNNKSNVYTECGEVKGLNEEEQIGERETLQEKKNKTRNIKKKEGITFQRGDKVSITFPDKKAKKEKQERKK